MLHSRVGAVLDTIQVMYPPEASAAHLLVLARLGANQARSAGL